MNRQQLTSRAVELFAQRYDDYADTHRLPPLHTLKIEVAEGDVRVWSQFSAVMATYTFRGDDLVCTAWKLDRREIAHQLQEKT